MSKATQTPSPRTRRLGVAEAKSKLSELMADQHLQGSSGAAFLQRVEAVKHRHGGGADFEPARLAFVPVEPFA